MSESKDGKVVSGGEVVMLGDHLRRISLLAAKSPKAKRARRVNWLRMMATRYPEHPKWGEKRLEENVKKLVAGEKD